MKVIFSRPLFAYIMGLLILVLVSGAILSQLTNEYIILGSILTVEYIILLLIMLHVYDK